MDADGKLSMVVLGCGSRGRMFSRMVNARPEWGRIVAVADPIAERREQIGAESGVAPERRYKDWREVLAGDRIADLAMITLMDREHVGAAIRALELGYHLLLEKPMAVTMDDCAAIDAARRKSGRIVSVCHGMRYSLMYAKVKEIIDSGRLGKLVTIDQLEGVDPQHQSHSFVRGNWGNEGRASFMLLQKSCHDIDVIGWLMGENAVKVSSFGGLSHFKKAHQPAGAPARCVEGCPVGDHCPYNAVTLYREGKGYGSWIGLDEKTQEEREKFLWESHYGRCAYDVDNDVVDHQVVAMQFPSGATGTFTMTAFAPAGRRLRICGTHGYLDSITETHIIEVTDYWGPQRKVERIEVPRQEGSHGGADENVMRQLVEAIRANDPSKVLTGTDESLRTHAVVFAAEAARRSGQVVTVTDGKISL
jgi:predicted dehydrogenase